MSLRTGNVFQVQVKSIQAGELCYVNLWYAVPGIDVTTVTAAQVANEFVTEVIPAWRDLISAEHTIISVKATRRGTPNAGQEYVAPVNLAGNQLGHVLPVFNTFSFDKFPDNSTKEPVGVTDFRTGRIAVSGVPEGAQNNGIIEASFLTLADAFAAAVDGFVIDGFSFELSMARAANVIGTEDSAGVFVGSVQLDKIGTQNTRKG